MTSTRKLLREEARVAAWQLLLPELRALRDDGRLSLELRRTVAAMVEQAERDEGRLAERLVAEAEARGAEVPNA